MEATADKVTEAEFVEKLTRFLSKYFTVKPERWSQCGNGRIDLILKHSWQIYFGVEVKRDDKKKGEEMGEFIKQAIRYTKYKFEVEDGIFKQIPILICPPLSYRYFILNEFSKAFPSYSGYNNGNELWHQDRHPENCKHHSFNGFLGAFGIGELRSFISKYETSYFISHSNKVIWTNAAKWFDGKRSKTEIQGMDIEKYSQWNKKLSEL